MLNRKARTATAVFATMAIASAGIGGYAFGQRTGEDLDAARAAGQRKGEKLGAKRDYREGYRQGRRTGHRRAYPHAYTRAYRRELEQAGLARPDVVKVPRAGR